MPYSSRKVVDLDNAIYPCLLDSCFSAMRAHCPFSPCPHMHGFNTLVQCNIPKKEILPFEHGVACRAKDTRSLTCKNTSNKHICTTVAVSLMPNVREAAAEEQRGFINKRHFTDNVLIVDTVSRIYSNLFEKFGNSVIAFFDFANAFPSMYIQWIFLVLKFFNFPLGIQQFVHALYTQFDTYMKHGGVMRHLCFVKNGVLQGCPLAALLFVVAMDPFVQLFNLTVDSLSLGVTCLCADDIASVLRSCAQLIDIYI